MMQFNLNSIRVSKSSKSIELEPTTNQPKSIGWDTIVNSPSLKKYLLHKLGNVFKIQVDTFEWVKQFQWWKKDVQEYLNLIMFFFFFTFQMVKNSFNPFCWQIKFELFRLGRDLVWCKKIFWSKFYNVNLQICHSNIQAFIALFKIKIDLIVEILKST